MTTTTLEQEIREVLAGVPDPEIPALSIADLGMVERVEATDEAVEVDLLPTFIGCPAKGIIGKDVEAAVRAVAGQREVRVRFVLRPPWTTDRITDEGKAALRATGIAPHWERGSGPVVVPLMKPGSGVRCPYCGSTQTLQESSFGATPCRAQHFCSACREPFEGFKEK